MRAPVVLLKEALSKDGKHYEVDRESGKVILNTNKSPVEVSLFSPSGFENHSLQTIINLWERRNDSYAEYLKWTATNSEEPVSFMHRKLVLDFLTGAADTLPGFSKEQNGIDEKTIEKCMEISFLQKPLNSLNTGLFIPSSRQKDFSEILSVSRAKFTSEKAVSEKLKKQSALRKAPNFKTQIIIVPSGVQPMINMFNVKSFLVDGLYVPMSKVSVYQGKPESVVIERPNSGNGHRKYRVIDSVENLNSEDWNQVIAAFVTGQTWQFSKWKWKDPAILFEKMRGFCVRYMEDPPPGNSGQWAVKELLIHRTWRHNDRSATNMFWSEVEAFAALRLAQRSEKL